MPGPVPKRSDQRRRRNKPDDGMNIIQLPGISAKPPRVNPNWCTQAKNWYRSLASSGQAQFYQNSDWQTAQLVALLLTKELERDGGPRAGMMDVIFSAMGELLTTEGARRRLRIELTVPDTSDRDDTAAQILQLYKEEFSS